MSHYYHQQEYTCHLKTVYEDPVQDPVQVPVQVLKFVEMCAYCVITTQCHPVRMSWKGDNFVVMCPECHETQCCPACGVWSGGHTCEECQLDWI